MKNRILSIIITTTLIFSLTACGGGSGKSAAKTGSDGLYATTHEETDSPEWVKKLPSVQDDKVSQLFIVAGLGEDKTTATVSMHERDNFPKFLKMTIIVE